MGRKFYLKNELNFTVIFVLLFTLVFLCLIVSSVFVAYWEALLPTVATGCKKPSEWETVECVKCVLENGNLINR